jgi:hypothetical protein
MGERLKTLVPQGFSAAFLFWGYGFWRANGVYLPAQAAFNGSKPLTFTPLWRFAKLYEFRQIVLSFAKSND